MYLKYQKIQYWKTVKKEIRFDILDKMCSNLDGSRRNEHGNVSRKFMCFIYNRA